VNEAFTLSPSAPREVAPAPDMWIQAHKGNDDYGTPWELEHE